ncbi:MAG: hypothetical protein U0892_22465 [Pirellulales bacterium]
MLRTTICESATGAVLPQQLRRIAAIAGTAKIVKQGYPDRTA